MPHAEAGHDPSRGGIYAAAFEFGWQSFMQYGRDAATRPKAFEQAEAQLEQLWRSQQTPQNCQPWESARQAARDAWDQVQAALLDGSQPKSSAR